MLDNIKKWPWRIIIDLVLIMTAFANVIAGNLQEAFLLFILLELRDMNKK